MGRLKKRIILAASIAVLGICSVVSAEGEGERPSSDFSLGAGAAYRSSIYRGDDERVIPIPLIFYETDSLFLKGLRGGYHLFKHKGFSFDLIVQFRTDGYDDDDSRALRGMSDRRMSIDGGIGCSYNDGWGMTSVSFLSDLLGNHDGQELSLSYSKRFTKGEWSFVPSAGVLWQSSNLTDYYYGVRGREVGAGRPQYSAGEAWNPFVGLQVIYEINPDWSAMTMFRYRLLDSEIRGSPIVGDDYEISAMAGLMYKF